MANQQTKMHGIFVIEVNMKLVKFMKLFQYITPAIFDSNCANDLKQIQRAKGVSEITFIRYENNKKPINLIFLNRKKTKRLQSKSSKNTGTYIRIIKQQVQNQNLRRYFEDDLFQGQLFKRLNVKTLCYYQFRKYQ